jgi:hypothetical protein
MTSSFINQNLIIIIQVQLKVNCHAYGTHEYDKTHYILKKKHLHSTNIIKYTLNNISSLLHK